MARRIAFALALLLMLASELRAQIIPGGAGGGGSGSSVAATVTQSNASLLNATIVATSLPLPTGAATDAAVQDVEAAFRETTGLFDVAIPTSGQAVGFRNPQGKLASASLTNNNALLVELFGGITIGTVAQGASASSTGGWPVFLTDTADKIVRPGDQSNAAIRVRVVASDVASGGTSSNFGTVFPSTGTAMGLRHPTGAMASASVTNNNGLLVDLYGNVSDTSNNALRVNVVAGGAAGGTSSNFGTAWPSAGTAAGFKDPLGGMASATVDNTGRQIVTFATPVTFNSSQPTLNIRTTSDSTLTATVSVSSVTPIVNVRSTSDGTLTATVSGITSTVNARTTSDSTLTATVTQTTAANLNMRTDVSAATGTLAPSRVHMQGALGGSATAVNLIACDQTASISTANSGNWLLVASQANKNIYVCGYTIVSSGPIILTFVQGRGRNGAWDPACNNSSSNLTGRMFIAASGGAVNANSTIPVLKLGVAQSLCINLSDNKEIGGHFTWTAF